jgi:transcriptional regulator with XRE-family HTH domain
MNYKDFHNQQMLKNPKYRKAYEVDDFEFEMSLLVGEIILASNLTRTEIAKRMGTKQPSISRAESGKIEPSWSYVRKLAKAAKVNLIMPQVDRRTTGTVYLRVNELSN